MEDLPLFRHMLGYGEDLPRRFLIENGAEPLRDINQLEHATLAYVFTDTVKRRAITRRRLPKEPIAQIGIANGPVTIENTCDRYTGDFSKPANLYLVRGTFDLYNLSTRYRGRKSSRTGIWVVEDDHAFVVPDRDAMLAWFAPDHIARRAPDTNRTIN